ncbi:peptidase S9 [Pseudoalteromonas sp. A25]|uniref:alpha/beta hydrolase family protein n=1 Tax=Pseudoalteromonas sp. A25 TaxID=116092 RepID=UPI001261268F|nr:prolyl oligopeptidase family serine peptidase [Pseudoalteromonas sp. A25]BBN80264.1 peptidase S9 [Pseudoalteromonas sp. A25]
MILRTVATLLASALTLQLNAAPLNEKQIQFLGPIPTHSNIKPNNTAHQNKIIQTLLPSLKSSSDSLSIFGNSIDWQNLADINALTLPGIQVLKFSFATTRFTQGKINLSGVKKAHVFLNGEQLTGEKSYDLHAVTGDHQVIIITEQVDNWNEVSIDYVPQSEHDQITLHNNEQVSLSAKQLFDSPTISALSQSPNGRFYITTQRHYSDLNGNTPITETLIKKQDGSTIYRLDGVSANNVAWRSDSKQLAYVQANQLKTLDLKTMTSRVIADKLDGASNFEYFDDSSLIFSWSNTPKDSHTLVKHYRGLEDRWSYARINNQVYLLDINSGLISALTEGTLSHSLEDHDAQRNTILVSRNPQNYQAPPHMLTELIEINLSDNQQTMIGAYRTFKQAKYANRGIYIVAGPDFANGIGKALPDGMLANNYDGQLFWLNNNGEQPKPLSKSFDPAVANIQVLSNDDVVMLVTNEDKRQLYLYDKSKSHFKHIKTGFDVVDQFDVTHGQKADVLVAGTQASVPQQLKRVSLSSNKAKRLWDSQQIAYKNSHIAQLEEFNFTNKLGTEIKGRVYLPHNLDKTKRYPALVYYYGGTSPVSRAFTGRYPFNLWAAHGYVVYVLQPTGATGFGQQFSAQHVNAWGENTAQDIIDGTKAFTDAYSFVDPKRIGNLGASYGGFMTMLLATKTDMFSASIAHAGISNITSYWGQGWWGYLYSGEASKNSFPWNNPTLYSQHSPVFHADKVKTPLLLIHGDADTNVPPGESHNMYTALKILGKDVELIEYKGANHQILARDRRFQWWDTMLAYFDMHLKQQPQWWQHIYKK